MQTWIRELSSFVPSGLTPWLPALTATLLWLVVVASWGRPLRRMRWAAACGVLATPLLFPRPSAETQVPWAQAATILTTLLIIFAARLPDWDAIVLRNGLRFKDRFLWLLCPNLQLRAQSVEGLARVRRAAPYLLKATLLHLTWLVVSITLSLTTADGVPWPLRSAILMLFFVLNVTALHDAVAGCVILAGYRVDNLFDAPLLSRSPRDFWSRRWNKFINRFALKHVALKSRRLPPEGTILLVFGCSGLFHEYFAWGVGGQQAVHGKMMLFFLIQGAAVLVGSKWSPPLPDRVLNLLTFIWMALTAPLFFTAVQPAVLAFGFPEAWLPF